MKTGLLICFLISFVSFSQDKIWVRGKVATNEHQPLADAVLFIYTPDSTLLSLAVSEKDGSFEADGGDLEDVGSLEATIGYNITEQPVHIHDLHATLLHCLGLDHEKLTYRYQGRDFRLTDVHGKLVAELVRAS